MLKHTLAYCRSQCAASAMCGEGCWLRPSVVFFIVLVFGLLACLPTGVRVRECHEHSYSSLIHQYCSVLISSC